MSVSFKRPPAAQVVRRDGTVEDRETGRVLGTVRQDRGGRWHHSHSALQHGWPTRGQAVEALSTAADRTNGSEYVLSGQDSGECEHGDHEACDGTTPGFECLCSCHTDRTNGSREERSSD